MTMQKITRVSVFKDGNDGERKVRMALRFDGEDYATVVADIIAFHNKDGSPAFTVTVSQETKELMITKWDGK